MQITRKNKAFTLAEVLITLAIIGVIAALTIPALLDYTKDIELKSGLKEFYSLLNSAQNQAIQSDNYVFGASLDNDVLELSKYISIVKTCQNGGTGMIGLGCWYNDTSANAMLQMYASGWNESGGILKNGMIFHIDPNWAIIVDVNAFKGPNQPGRDVWIFLFDTTNKKWIPGVKYGADSRTPLLN